MTLKRRSSFLREPTVFRKIAGNTVPRTNYLLRCRDYSLRSTLSIDTIVEAPVQLSEYKNK